MNDTVLLLPCACKGREEDDFKSFFASSFPFHLYKTHTYKPIPCQERDTMPCKHSRPPYPAEVRQPVPPLHHDETEQGGTPSLPAYKEKEGRIGKRGTIFLRRRGTPGRAKFWRREGEQRERSERTETGRGRFI